MKLLVCLLACAALAASQSCPPEDVHFFSDSQYCDRYVECREGVQTEQQCPDGLLFNDQVTNGRYPCDYPAEVDCGSRSKTQTPQPTENCGHQWGYFGSGDPQQCGFFYNCVDGVSHLINCPAGLAFSSFSYRCEWPDESPDCDSAAFLGFSCPAESNTLALGGYTQHSSPRDCRQFFICVNSSPRLQFCQLGLVFDEVTYTCVDPQYVSGCENYYTPEELELYREQRERQRLAEERRREELEELRQQLAQRRRQQQP
ncbi:protein obstructor-E-like [Homarus americanus]|uniref:protein obstructor-E-like n=1 Tax=Homarus americanus TaxID=6706 RepID=UPI001C439490|nr:protein obstructor-E-like [Homarus americanus]